MQCKQKPWSLHANALPADGAIARSARMCVFACTKLCLRKRFMQQPSGLITPHACAAGVILSGNGIQVELGSIRVWGHVSKKGSFRVHDHCRCSAPLSAN